MEDKMKTYYGFQKRGHYANNGFCPLTGKVMKTLRLL